MDLNLIIILGLGAFALAAFFILKANKKSDEEALVAEKSSATLTVLTDDKGLSSIATAKPKKTKKKATKKKVVKKKVAPKKVKKPKKTKKKAAPKKK